MFRHAHANDEGIDSTSVLVAQEVAGATEHTININASVASDFALDVNFGNGWVNGWKTYSSTDAVQKNVTVVAEQIRVRNTTAQAAGDTASVDLASAGGA